MLYRAKREFFDSPQWSELGDWENLLTPLHHRRANAGCRPVPFDSVNQQWIRDMGRHFGFSEDTVTDAPTGVFFGEPGKTVPDPTSGGAVPDSDQLHPLRCLHGGLQSRRGQLADQTTCGSPNATAYRSCPNIRSSASPRWATRRQRRLPGHHRTPPGRPTSQPTDPPPVASSSLAERWARTELLASCKHGGSLPRISDRQPVVRTNSESVLTVRLPGTARQLAGRHRQQQRACRYRHPHQAPHHGPRADMFGLLYTVLVGDGARITRPLKWLATITQRTRRWLRTPVGWSGAW